MRHVIGLLVILPLVTQGVSQAAKDGDEISRSWGTRLVREGLHARLGRYAFQNREGNKVPIATVGRTEVVSWESRPITRRSSSPEAWRPFAGAAVRTRNIITLKDGAQFLFECDWKLITQRNLHGRGIAPAEVRPLRLGPPVVTRQLIHRPAE